MSPEAEQDYFCDGISEEIINALTRVPALNVVARTSAFQFKGASIDIREIGSRLGAELVIEGSVRKAGSQIRITAQAIQADSGHHLWSETFRRELKDVFSIQEEIAASVASLLQLHLPTERLRPVVPGVEAYTRYLRARFLIHQQTPETLRTALQELTELSQAYPDYAPAYSGIAAAAGLLTLFGVVSGRDAYAQVKANAERGFALEPESAETCAVLAGLRSWFEHDWQQADSLYERALQLQPGYVPAHMFRGMTLLCRRDLPAAETALRRSVELDPLSAGSWARMAYLHYVKGDYQTAAGQLAKSFDHDRDYPEARFYQGLLHFQQQNYDSVVECLASSPAPLDLGLVAAAHARKGRASRARECLAQLTLPAPNVYVTPLAEAFAAIGLQNYGLAFERLQEAIEHRTNFVNLLAVEPFFDPLRKHRRFSGLLKQLHLPG